MSSLEALYQQVILDHSRRRSGEGPTGDFEFTSFQVNPTCGDEVTLGVKVDDEGRPVEVTWEGDGCSISQASLSMMVEELQSADLERVRELYGAMETMMHSRGKGVADDLLDQLGDGAALEGTSKFPNRVKCALLGWYALRDAMAKAGVDITEVAEISAKGDGAEGDRDNGDRESDDGGKSGESNDTEENK